MTQYSPTGSAGERWGRQRAATVLIRLAGALLVLAGVVTAGTGQPTGGASAPTPLTATFVADNFGGTTPITSGVSDTPFGVALQSTTPANGGTNNRANCPADSATGNTYAYTYLIPSTDNVLDLNLSGGNPGVLPNHDESLVLTDLVGGTVETNTNDAQLAPGTAQVILAPQTALGWSGLQQDTIAASDLYGKYGGKWVGGYACYNGSAVTRFWQFSITFTQSAVGPNNSQGYSWTVTSGTGGGTTTTTRATGATTTAPTTTTLAGGATTTNPPNGFTNVTPAPSGGTTTPPTATPAAGGTPGASGGGGSSGAAGGSGSGASGGDPSASSGQLAATGAPLRHQLSLAIILAMLGVSLLLASLLVPARRHRPTQAR